MKDDDLIQDANDALEEEFGESYDNQQIPNGAFIIDSSTPESMLDGLVKTFGEVHGIQMFSDMAGLHMLNGKLLLSMASPYDTIH